MGNQQPCLNHTQEPKPKIFTSPTHIRTDNPLADDFRPSKTFTSCMETTPQSRNKKYLHELTVKHNSYAKEFAAQQQKQDQNPSITRKDVASLTFDGGPNNTVQLIDIHAYMEDALLLACGGLMSKYDTVMGSVQLKIGQLKASWKAKKEVSISTEVNKLETMETDEISHCSQLAKLHISQYKEHTSLLQVCSEISKSFERVMKDQQFAHLLQNNDRIDQWESNWYRRFASVLVREAAGMSGFLQQLKETGTKLSTRHEKSAELVTYYSCSLVIIRFLAGISWEYSPLLICERLDAEMSIVVKVTYNLLVRLKQLYREDPTIGPNLKDLLSASETVLWSEPWFKIVDSYEALDKLVCTDSRQYSQAVDQYLTRSEYRKSYLSLKKELDAWLRQSPYSNSEQELDSSQKSDTIQVKELKSLKDFGEVNQDLIKLLKNPDLNLDGSLKDPKSNFYAGKTTQFLEMSRLKLAEENMASDGKPTLKVDNRKNIYLISGEGSDTRIAIESFLQAGSRPRSRYRCAMMHCVVAENAITRDSYYLVKHIIRGVVKAVPEIRSLLLLQTDPIFNEFLSPDASLQQTNKLI